MSAQEQPVAPCRVSAADYIARLSLYIEGRREAEKHKWIESERRGYDLGMHAVHDWYDRFWLGYCRRGRLDHVSGSTMWEEFDDSEFGCIYSLIVTGDSLLKQIFERIDAGDENLAVIKWAFDTNQPMPNVIDILSQIDVNRARLEPQL